jgi:predicted HTH domain antitoxin
MRIADAKSAQTVPSVTVTVRIPAEFAPQFGSNSETIGRRLLEQAAIEGYRSYQLSRGQVAQLLGKDWIETEEFLAQHHCDRHYDLQDLEEDRQTLDTLLGPA